MEITYKYKRMERICSDFSVAKKEYGEKRAVYIHQRIDQLHSAETVEQLVAGHIGRCHPLKGNRRGQYAMDVGHPYRLIFEKIGNEIQIVRIIEITDYH